MRDGSNNSVRQQQIVYAVTDLRWGQPSTASACGRPIVPTNVHDLDDLHGAAPATFVKIET